MCSMRMWGEIKPTGNPHASSSSPVRESSGSVDVSCSKRPEQETRAHAPEVQRRENIEHADQINSPRFQP